MAKIHLKHSTLQAGTGTPVTVRIETGELTDRTPNVNISDTGSGGEVRSFISAGAASSAITGTDSAVITAAQDMTATASFLLNLSTSFLLSLCSI